MQMSYARVFPRDFTREGNLLIGYGEMHRQLIDANNTKLELVELTPISAPEIEQDNSTGAIYISNLDWCIGEISFHCFLPLGSSSWKDLKMEFDDDVNIFNEEGKLSEEFLAALNDAS